MPHPARRLSFEPAMALVAAALWGLVEFAALWRSRWRERGAGKRVV